MLRFINKVFYKLLMKSKWLKSMELDIRKNRIYRNKRYLHLNRKEGKKELQQLYMYLNICF